MSIEFKHGRMFVGWRRRDWSKVWYYPRDDVPPDSDGTMPIGLFKCAHGEPTTREPMEAEVIWLPHLGTDKNDADGRGGQKAREKIQMQFLYTAWKYLNERDPAQVAILDQEFSKPASSNWRKWDSWLTEGKKFKKRQLGNLATRRNKRRQAAQNIAATTGIALAELDYNSDTSADADDSGFEAEDQSRRIARRSEMPHPRLYNKRDGSGTPSNIGKKQRPNPKKRARSVAQKDSSPPPLTGSPGGLVGHALWDSTRVWPKLGTHSPPDPDSGEEGREDRESPVYDTRPSDHSSRGSGRVSVHSGSRLSVRSSDLATGKLAAEKPTAKDAGEQELDEPLPDGNEDGEDMSARELNGGLSFDAATQEAIRRSQVPEEGEQTD